MIQSSITPLIFNTLQSPKARTKYIIIIIDPHHYSPTIYTQNKLQPHINPFSADIPHTCVCVYTYNTYIYQASQSIVDKLRVCGAIYTHSTEERVYTVYIVHQRHWSGGSYTGQSPASNSPTGFHLSAAAAYVFFRRRYSGGPYSRAQAVSRHRESINPLCIYESRVSFAPTFQAAALFLNSCSATWSFYGILVYFVFFFLVRSFPKCELVNERVTGCWDIAVLYYT